MRSLERRKLQERAVNLLTRMVEIYSPTGYEEPLALFLTEELQKRGFKIYRDKVGNLFGTKGTVSPHILLCGHMDVVPPELPIKLEDGVLYGRGTADAKGPLAAMIEAATQLFEEGFEAHITVGGLVDEEGNNVGSKQLSANDIDVDYAIFGEPTNVDTVTVGYKGGLLVEITCKTETGHSSAPWMFQNSIEKSMEIWKMIKGLHMPEENMDSKFFSLSKNLRYITGGRESSVVPDSSTIQIGIRIPPGITVESLTAEVTTLIKEYQSKNPDVGIDMNILDHSEPILADKKTKVVKAFAQAIYRKHGKPVMLVNKTGTGDMNIFGPATGIPVITYGPGNSHLDHTSKEHIVIENYLEGIAVLKEALKTLVKLHHR